MAKVKTEKEMSKEEAPFLKTMAELAAYIDALTNREHGYGTCVYAMSLSASAAFNYVASKLGVSGFQASCAQLEFLREQRNITGSFVIIKGDDLLHESARVEQLLADLKQAALKDEKRKAVK